MRVAPYLPNKKSHHYTLPEESQRNNVRPRLDGPKLDKMLNRVTLTRAAACS